MGLLGDAFDKAKKARPTTGDQIRGFGRAIRSEGLNAGMSPLKTLRYAKEVRDERQAREEPDPRSYASRYRSASGKIDVLIDRNGNPTKVYPHVHVVFSEAQNGIIVTASRSENDHPHKVFLPANAGGNDVNREVERAITFL